MRHFLISSCFTLGLALSPVTSNALTDTYFATGEDIDFLIESDNLSEIREIEYQLRRFVIFRKVEDYIFSITDTFTIFED
jgi:hypothetical protein